MSKLTEIKQKVAIRRFQEWLVAQPSKDYQGETSE
jgi:hypothetical protein